MSLKKNKSKISDSLVVVAHPDDETIFFSGLILSKPYKWRVICVTDGNADGDGAHRAGQFKEACRRLHVKDFEMWNFPDEFDRRLDALALAERLRNEGRFKRIFTHGILGEYGHLHHQDVSYATHAAFKGGPPVFSIAYNTFPDLPVRLTPRQYKMKTSLLWDVYGSEAKRLLNYLPATSFEGFVRVDFAEVEALYSWLCASPASDGGPDTRAIRKYRWLLPYLEQGGGRLSQRLF